MAQRRAIVFASCVGVEERAKDNGDTQGKDVSSLLRPGDGWNVRVVYSLVKSIICSALRSAMSARTGPLVCMSVCVCVC